MYKCSLDGRTLGLACATIGILLVLLLCWAIYVGRACEFLTAARYILDLLQDARHMLVVWPVHMLNVAYVWRIARGTDPQCFRDSEGA